MGNCTIACGPYNKVLPKTPQISLLCVIVILKPMFVLLQQIYQDQTIQSQVKVVCF